MPLDYLVFGVTVLLGILASLLIPDHGGIRGRVWNAVASGSFGALLATLFLLLMTMSEVRSHLAQETTSTAYARVRRQMSEISDRAPLVARRRWKLAIIEKDLAYLAEGRVNLQTENEVIETWLAEIRSSRHEILATNLVRPGVWLENAEMRGPGRTAQKDAAYAESPVTIKRIWIYSAADTPSHEAVQKVSYDQQSIGVDVRYLTLEELQKQVFVATYEQQIGSLDIVLFDGASVLATNTNPADYSIRGGYITTESEIVQAARELFERLWQISRTEFYTPAQELD